MRRRTDLTFKHNQKRGRYGWLRLTPAYSLKMVRRYLQTSDDAITVLDPFAGSGTTPLYAAYHGFRAEALELNPFLVWFMRVKTARYPDTAGEELELAADRILDELHSSGGRQVDPPPIRNIERWWSPSALNFLRSLKAGIEDYASEDLPESTTDLLRVCFCRTLIKISNAAFNHQSMSFDDDSRQLSMFEAEQHFRAVFLHDVGFVADSLHPNPITIPRLLQGDARRVGDYVSFGVDKVVTSPPYPNRMSYIRELRPYMYWLGYLKQAREAGELDWRAIGGTWGIATSRLSEWCRDEQGGYYPSYFKEILRKIANDKNMHGLEMANYVARYFEDVLEHFSSLVKVLHSGAQVHFVVGNSTFYGVLVPVERLYAEVMHLTGLREVEVETVRKRNSKRRLYEFAVSGKKP